METTGLTIRGIEFGLGMPKICVPIVAREAEEALAQARQSLEKKPDMLELRIDWFSKAADWDSVDKLLKELRELIGGTILLFTLRTAKEGGETEISVEDYKRLGIQACKSGLIDLLDVEAFMEDHLLEEMAKAAHDCGVYVIGSSHDFDGTPREDELVRRLQFMEQHGADIPKIAVMPKSKRDVLTLLSATLAYREAGGRKPVITMSMAGQGIISRLAGETFGSAVTFASVGKSSAPGQIPVEEMKQVLGTIHRYQ
ncbi:MAG: type I 3-dehydroquinate dehydratase [Bacteroidales bacterium]|nr:type I 3-dehydroquinate dehydratase [Clostridium sp.]MCM1203550.1 type I 3-dehydroquinate dehydratase [Bacteroidales bacterium]